MTGTAPVFRYDAERHEYFYNEQRVPSITQLVEMGGLLGTGADYYTEASRERGSAVHGLAQSYDLGALGIQDLDASPYRGYGLGYIDAMRVLSPLDFSGEPGWEEVEVFDVHPTFRYGGRRDRVGVVFQRKTVLEIKTGAKCEKAHGAQLALQSLMAEARYGLPATMWQRIGLQLKPSGKYTPWIYEDERDFDRAHDLIRRFCRV